MTDITAGYSQIGLDFYKDAVQSVAGTDTTDKVAGNDSFSNILNVALNLVQETESLTEQAEKATLDFTLGNTESTHEMMIAQQKAYTSLQYTVAVKNAFLDAYKEIMQIQI